MAFNQLTTLENFEYIIWHNEIPGHQVFEAVDRLTALTYPEEVFTFCEIFCFHF